MKTETENSHRSNAVAVLCARIDSIYKTMPTCDVYDEARDARTFAGGLPVIAHPPCRLWGRLYKLARSENPEAERAFGVWCAGQVRTNGGVLEHPAHSKLWKAAGLPKPGERDEFGGWTLAIPQFWFGHKAEKNTWFYIVGIDPSSIPPITLKLGEPTHVVSSTIQRRGEPGYRPSLKKKAREATPPAMAQWLVDLASMCVAPIAQKEVA
jgi:hypothetical protein